MTEPQGRPGQATLAGWLIVAGSVLLVLSAWQRISTLHTLDVQRELEQMIDGQPAMLGLTVDSLSTVMRILCVVGGGAATAAAMLGVQVFRRSVPARIALTALSPLLFIGGLATAGFLAPMVVAGIVLLWMSPTRDWYAGRPWVPRGPARPAAGAPRSGAPTSGTPTSGAATDRAWGGPGESAAVEAPSTAAEPAPAPAAGGAVVAGGRASFIRPGRRPGALLAACLMTWVLSSIAVLGFGVVATQLADQGDDVYADMTRQQPDLAEQITRDDLVASMYVVIAGLILWSLAAIVLAGLAFMGQNWARIVLVVFGICAALVALFAILVAPPLVVAAAALAATVWLLLRPEVGEWFVQRH